MKKTLILLCSLLFAVSCTKYSANISGNINGLSESPVLLQKLNFNRLETVDTLTTNASGDFKYRIKLDSNNPAFYYLYRNDVKIAGMVLLDGDNVTLTADTLGNYSVEGSQESINLKFVDDSYSAAAQKMISIINEAPQDANAQVSKVYIDHKRAMMKHVLNNPKSITAATTMFQKFNADLPVFNEETDVFIFKTVLDSLSATYPESEYLLALKDEISRREAIANLNRKLESIEEQSFPNIIMTDINGEKHSLLDLQGKVILLSFWSTSQTEHKMFNNELLPVYEKYHDNGFEVYQVCLDVDKPTWASTVRSQNLPWISVNDGLEVMSSAISSYVIEYLPTMFIINKEGDIVAKDIFDANYLDGIIKSLI